MALNWSRRGVFKLAAVGVGVNLARGAVASPADADRAVAEVFGLKSVAEGPVTVTIPPISENGYTVPIRVEVDSPMTPENHVRRIAIFAEENPIAHIATFELGPDAGRAIVETRIRMGGSQRIRAVAELSDGTLISGYDFSIVTLAACVV
jgi:sulfur-oxidizing protein SoxY